jgi:DNA-binding Lrp family transcriptional regulator
MPKPWTFLTNHALILLHVYEFPNSTLREIAQAVGITERAALSILRQLEKDSCIWTTKQGRRNQYAINLPAVFSRDTRSPYTIRQMVRGLANLFQQLPREGSEAAAGATAPGAD